MRPKRVTVSSQAASNPIPMDTYIDPFNVSIRVDVAGGSTLTYSVQHTFDDVFADGYDPATGVWTDNDTLTGDTASGESNYAFPVTAIRLNVTAHTTGSATMTLIQTGRGGN